MPVQVSLSDIWLILPAIVLFVASLVPISIKVFTGNKEQPLFASLAQALIGVLIALTSVFTQWDNQTGFAFSQALVFDGISSWASAIVLLSAGVSMLLMFDNIQTKQHQFSEQLSLVLSATIGMLIVAWSNDLIVTFIGIELMSLALYVTIGLGEEQKLSKEAAFKYFVLGSFGSAILLYGISLIYGGAETVHLSRLAEAAPALMLSNKIFLIGVILFVVGLAFKIAVFPFHAWTPDVYQGAPTPVTAFMATGVKLVVFVVLIRLALTGVFTGSEKLVNVLEWVAALSIFAGNLAALKQSNFKRMLAYSSIAHSGYLLIGVIAVATSSAPTKAISSILFYLLTYTVMTLGTFAVASLYEKTEKSALYIDDLKGLAHKRPGLAFLLTLLLLSIAGIPPFAGFFGKLYLFSAAVAEGLFWPVVWGVLGSVVGVVYYMRPIVNMYMHEPSPYFEEPLKYNGTRLALTLSALVVVVLGVFSSPVVIKLQTAVQSLFAAN